MTPLTKAQAQKEMADSTQHGLRALKHVEDMLEMVLEQVTRARETYEACDNDFASLRRAGELEQVIVALTPIAHRLHLEELTRAYGRLLALSVLRNTQVEQ